MNLSEEEAFDYEIKLIAQFGRIDLGTGCLCNHTNGGQGSSNAHIGLKHTIDSRINMSIAASKRKVSKEGQERRTKAVIKAKGRPVCSFDLVSRQVIKEYTHLRAVENDGFKHKAVWRVINGRLNSHRGLGWRYC
jgi:hypothetical protein